MFPLQGFYKFYCDPIMSELKESFFAFKNRTFNKFLQTLAPHFLGATELRSLCCPGDPLPRVFWYRNDKMIDDSDMKTFENTVKNRIVITSLVRADLHAR